MGALAVFRSIWTENSGLDRLVYLLRGIAWQARKRLGHSFVTTLPNGARVQVRPVSTYSQVFYFRHAERKDLQFLERHGPGLADTFVDVGANVGLFSAALFGKFGRFILFEPAPSSFAALQATLRLNPVQAEARNMGVGDASGSLHFLDEGDCSTTSRFVADPAPGQRTIEVPCDTLDNQLSRDGRYVVKIDVEGFEERVFLGARGLLRDQRIRLVMFERLQRTNLERVTALLESFGYAVFYVEEDGRVTRDAAVLARPLVNLFAAPAEVVQRLQ